MADILVVAARGHCNRPMHRAGTFERDGLVAEMDTTFVFVVAHR